jgi:ribosomal-protein-alanine N-acetyltransferase
MTEQLKIHIRWLIRRDMPEVMEIENSSFDDPWTQEQFVFVLRQRNSISYVAVHDEQVVGYICYELFKKRLDILNLAVHSDFRRRGVGRQMVEKLANKLSSQRRTLLRVFVIESNLAGQLFYSSCGMICSCAHRGHGAGLSSYQFNYRAGWETASSCANLSRAKS